MSLLIVTTLDDETFDGGESTAAPDGAGLSLREALGIANADPDTQDDITFDPSLSGGTLTLAQGGLTIAGDTTIDGDLDNDATPDITIDGGGVDTILTIVNTDLDLGNGIIEPLGSTSTVELTGLALTGGYSFNGGSAIETTASFLYNGDVTLRDSELFENTSVFEGTISGIYSNFSIYGTTVTNNYGSGFVGGDYFSVTTIRDSEISHNTGDGVSGVGNSTVRIDSSEISENGGSGVSIFTESVLTIANSEISANKSSGIFTGLYVDGFIDGSVISNNEGTYGAGILAGYGSSTSLVDTIIKDNSASAKGGGIYIEESGVGTYVYTSGLTIQGNSATAGGGIFNSGNLQDGAFYSFFGEGDRGSRIIGNTATEYGGGIATDPGNNIYSSLSTTLQGTLIAGNSAGIAGGGISNRGSYVSLTNATVTNNAAATAGGVLTEPSGTYGPYGGYTLEVTSAVNSIIAGNVATDPGGAADLVGSISLRSNNILSATLSNYGTPVQSGFSPDLIFAQGGEPGALLADENNPALDAGDDVFVPPLDINGVPRPVDLPEVANNGGYSSDLGALELESLGALPPGAPISLNVFAAGVDFQGDPEFDVLVNGLTIASGLTAGRTTTGNTPANLRDEVQRFEFDIDPGTDIEEVSVVFTNDLNGPGGDRALFVRAVEVDGHVFQPGTPAISFDTDSPSAEVTQQAEDRGIVHANGSLDFDVTGEAPQLIVVQGAAQVFNGFPKFDVLVNGATIAEDVFNPLGSFEPFTPGNLPDETDAFFFEVDPTVEIEEVAIVYDNDLSGAGGDRNLFIQSVAVGGELFLPGVDNFAFDTEAANPAVAEAAEERGVLFANGTLTLTLDEEVLV